jgi:serine/tyrosine/threonine adenylyltransferase
MSVNSTSNVLQGLNFDNQFTRNLPCDPELQNFRRQVAGACYSRVNPTPVRSPQVIAYAKEVCELLDLDSSVADMLEFAEVFGGNRVLSGMDPFAMCYGGHQFGSWAGQLGDGRAINLGEVVNARGERWMLQLKGAGPTPYSRTADGLAVLRSSVREFLCSEAMFHLGVPTTRALSLVGTGELVERDMFYNGNPRREPGAVVCRVAPTFTRFGNFQIFNARGDIETLRKLVTHTLRTDFPHLLDSAVEISDGTICNWFSEVSRLTAEMIVHWMRVGFVHGVMNTDNMSILGLTIDYGPYGWVEDYDPYWTPNTTDASGRRYRFGQQAEVAHWNLWQLANAIAPLVSDHEPLQTALNQFPIHYENLWQTMMAKKLGLVDFRGSEDRKLIDDLLSVLQLVETDMTIFFRKLACLDLENPTEQCIADAYYSSEPLTEEARVRTSNWFRSYVSRLKQDSLSNEERRRCMHQVNPKYVLRNYLAQLAIDKAEAGDASMIHELLDTLRQPYAEQPEREEFAAKRPDWARSRAGCSMLSCSS